MGAYDNVYIHEDVEVELDGLPFDAVRRDDGRARAWQTKDLHPSMDCYAIRPYAGTDEGDPFLYRRHPPLWRWTEHNEGPIGDREDLRVFDGVDHWRLIKVSGVVEMTEAVSGDGEVEIYDLEAVFEQGKLRDIELVGTDAVEATIVPPEEGEIIEE